MSEERVCLDFLLRELRRWSAEGRIPGALLTPLIDEYAARREALDPPRLAMFDLSHDLTPPPTPMAPPRRGLLAFLEERNIATLHLVGSLLLLAGLVLLVQWQWDGIGRFLLLFVLALAAAGLLRLSDHLREEHPQSAQVLGVVGCLIIPLCGVALKVFGLASALSWPLVALVTALGSAGIYAARLRATQEPLLVALLAGAGAGAVWGIAGLVPTALSWPVGVVGLLALAMLCFRGAPHGELPHARMRLASGHALTLVSIGTALLWSAQVGGQIAQAGVGLSLLGAACLYGLLGSQLQVAWLGYAAVATASVGAQFLVPSPTSEVARGAVAAATGVLALLATRHRALAQELAQPYRNGAHLLTLLGIAPLLLPIERHDLPLAGLYLAAGVLWLVASRTAEGLLCTSLLGIATVRLLALPLNSWFVTLTQLPGNDLRWLLLPALTLGLRSLRATSADRAVALRQGALVATVWACGGQLLPLLDYSGAPRSAAASAAVLLIAAAGLGLWGLWQRAPKAAQGALLPLGAVMVVEWLSWINTAPLLPLPILGLSLALAGLAFPQQAERGQRAGLWLLAAGHMAAGVLPAALLPYWGLALVPVLLWLERTDSESSVPLPVTESFTILSYLAVVLLPSGLTPAALSVTGLVLALIPLRRLGPGGVGTSALLATATVALVASGYPHPHFSLAQTGFVLAGLAAFWLGLSASLRRSTPLWETLSHVAVGTTTVAVASAVLGLGAPDQGRWTIFTLGLSAATLSATAGLRHEPRYLHSAFASAFAAFALYFVDQFGLGSDRLDYFLLPVGIYLLFVAERLEQAPLRAPGLLLLLGSSLLATTLNPHAWQHAVLLVLECLLAVGAGILRRVKVYLGGGFVFLIALLLNKLWDPLREINFGVYLTILGVGVLTIALQFEKRREALRRWTESVKDAYQSWE